MRTQVPNEQLPFNGQLGPGALHPGPRAQNTWKKTMNETAKRTVNESANKDK